MTTNYHQNMGEHLKTREFAERLRVNEESVRRWLRGKRLVGIKVGRDWRVPVTELARIERAGVI